MNDRLIEFLKRDACISVHTKCKDGLFMSWFCLAAKIGRRNVAISSFGDWSHDYATSIFTAIDSSENYLKETCHPYEFIKDQER